MINFKAKLSKVNSWTIIRLPKEASAKLSSRGQAMVEGTINGHEFQTPLEPDGQWSHWFKLDAGLLKSIGLNVGDTASLSIEPMTDWPDPEIPTDLNKALKSSSEASDLWRNITPIARWEWIRWIHSTGNQETRKRRIEVAISKLESGKRRPCCWNRNLCTEPSVSKNGILLDTA